MRNAPISARSAFGWGLLGGVLVIIALGLLWHSPTPRRRLGPAAQLWEQGRRRGRRR